MDPRARQILALGIAIFLEDEFSSEDERNAEAEMFKNRATEGAYKILICRHLKSNDEKFRQYFRLTPSLFQYVLAHIKQDLVSKPYNRNRTPISPEEKLCIFLRFLATGESFRSLSFGFRVSHSWISKIVLQVATSIVDRLLEIMLPPPTEEQLKAISQVYHSKWNFPNCVGAIDGKHVRMRAPANSGSLYFNYKEYFSMAMLAIVDADCKFVAVDVGSYGSEGDAGIYQKSIIGQKIRSGQFNIPPPKALPGTNVVLPHVIVGDAAFALHRNLMKPYPRPQSAVDDTKAVFNYRLSRARRTTENAFGIMSAYFRLFFQPIATVPSTTDKLVVSACILHNLLRSSKVLAPSQVHLDDSMPLPSKNFVPITAVQVRSRNEPIKIRQEFKTYFNGVGKVDWQSSYHGSF